MSSLSCCKVCDVNQWPGKIDKMEAKNKYQLQEYHLLPHQHSSGKLLTKYWGLPQLRYGTYMLLGLLVTVFMEADVEKLAELARGDFRAHLAKRKALREEQLEK
jgi:hypothetical protein